MTPADRATRAVSILMHFGPFGPGGEHDPARCIVCQVKSAVAQEIEEAVAETPAARWEADHQRRVLEFHGLADEFPFGCDAIDHVAGVLLAARDEIDRLKRGDFTEEEFQNLCHNFSHDDAARFKAGCEKYQRKLFGERKEEGHEEENRRPADQEKID